MTAEVGLLILLLVILIMFFFFGGGGFVCVFLLFVFFLGGGFWGFFAGGGGFGTQTFILFSLLTGHNMQCLITFYLTKYLFLPQEPVRMQISV